MWLKQFHWRPLGRAASKQRPAQLVRRRRSRLALEQLDERTLLTNYTAGTVSHLIADINAANAAGGANTITLVAGATFTLTAVNNSTDDNTGLPVIAANDNLTIAGNGDVIQRSTATGTPAFRLLDVAAGAALTLESLTLQGGLASNLYDFAGQGGAIYSNGSLTVANCTIQNNQARGTFTFADGGAIYSTGSVIIQSCTIQNNEAFTANGFTAAGGGIYSTGSLTVQSTTIQNDSAIGGNSTGLGGTGGSAFGGGIYIGGGTVDLSNVVLDLNAAQGGNGAEGGQVETSGRGGKPYRVGNGNGGNGLGGGLCIAAGTVTLRNTTVQNNKTTGGLRGGGGGASDGLGEGGGLYIASAASVSLDSFTLANVRNNTASTAYPNIYGSYRTS
jgi:hypothetical protein